MSRTKRNDFARELERDHYRQRRKEGKEKPTPRVEEWDFPDDELCLTLTEDGAL